MASRAVLIDGDSYEINYEKFFSNSGGNGCETILILHGWGANKELMSGVFASKFSDFNRTVALFCDFYIYCTCFYSANCKTRFKFN